jgi:hypothetical protein
MASESPPLGNPSFPRSLLACTCDLRILPFVTHLVDTSQIANEVKSQKSDLGILSYLTDRLPMHRFIEALMAILALKNIHNPMH